MASTIAPGAPNRSRSSQLRSPGTTDKLLPELAWFSGPPTTERQCLAGHCPKSGSLIQSGAADFDSDEKWGAGARHNRALPLCHPGTFAARVGTLDTANYARGRHPGGLCRPWRKRGALPGRSGGKRSRNLPRPATPGVARRCDRLLAHGHGTPSPGRYIGRAKRRIRYPHRIGYTNPDWARAPSRRRFTGRRTVLL